MLRRRRIVYSLTVCMFAACCLPASLPSQGWAVVITAGDGSGHTSAPGDDPGFANVGERGVGSAIYLGNRWVLTASHVGPGPVNFGGTVYANIVDEWMRLPNPDELGLKSALTDMVLFRLEEAPPLPAVYLPCDPISLGGDVVMIGRGRDRAAEESFWRVRFVAGEDNDEWTALGGPSGANKSGYLTLDTQTVRWGQNLVAITQMETNSGFGDVRSFSTSFSKSYGEDTAQGVRGDSGGAVFQKNDAVWELVGMMHAVGLEEKQPGATTTAVFGQDTFVADLYAYGDLLRELADFAPALGDVDGDGAFTARDIDLFHGALRESSGSCHLDLSGDSLVNLTDRDMLLALAETLPGDADLDGEVSFGDFLALSVAFGHAGGWSQGDFDGNGQVAFEDFLTLSRNFGMSFGDLEMPAGSLSSDGLAAMAAGFIPGSHAATVPEPPGAEGLAWGAVAAVIMLRAWRQVT